MRERLQKFDYRRSPYHRVTQDWVCGHAADGKPCRIGPDGKGLCRATAECNPLKDASGRWKCTRSELAGGRCPQGPNPDGSCCNQIPKCTPVRSIRAARKAAVRWVAVAAIGLAALVLGGASLTRDAFNPGDLSFQHAQMGDDCGACHSAGQGGVSGWLHAAFAAPEETGDNRLCLSCHSLGETPNSPHGLDQTFLASLTDKARARRTETASAGPLVMVSHGLRVGMGAPEAGLVCGACHSEHKGQDADIASMTDAQCQSCHVEAFDSFAGSHPDFGAYPYLKRTAIAFDHNSHIGKHFGDGKVATGAPTACADCHITAGNGERMLTRGFDTACASCHAGQIEGDGRATKKGVAVLNAPGFDLATMGEHRMNLGAWPEYAEAPPTPFVDLLLSPQPGYAEARRLLEALPTTMDMTDADDATVQAAETVGWAVKKLYYDLSVEGDQALARYMGAALGRDLSKAEMAELSALMPAAVLEKATAAWFPDMIGEMARHESGEAVGMPGFEPAPAPEPVPLEDQAAGDDGAGDILGGDDGGDILGGDGGDILGGGDDAGDGGLAALGGGDDGGDILGGDSGDILGGDGGDILGGGDDAGDGGLAALGGGDDGGDILGGDAGGDILGGGGGGILDGLGGGGDGGLAGLGGEPEETAVEPPAPVEPKKGENWATVGGWYVDDFDHAIRYRPTGHADRFLTAWLNLLGEARNVDAELRDGLFEDLANPRAVGLCTKCHGVSTENGMPKVSWAEIEPPAGAKPFTRFKHDQHFSLLGDKGCMTCHEFNPEAKYIDSFAESDPSIFESNFKPMQRSTCASCHVEDQAGDSCVMCHDYHVGVFPPAMASTALHGAMESGGQGVAQ